MKYNHIIRGIAPMQFAFLILMTVLLLPVQGIERIRNFGAVIETHDMVLTADSQSFWVATSGGLVKYDKARDSLILDPISHSLPDVHLTSLVFDAAGTLWVGTISGFLYAWSPNGDVEKIITYNTAGWDITSLNRYGDYLIIGSSKGCSVFSMSQRKAIKNATGFVTGTVPVVHSTKVYRDTLYLGLRRGYAKLNIANNTLLQKNFLDPSIWTITIDSDSLPIKSFVVDPVSGQVVPMRGASTGWRGSVVSADPGQVYVNSTAYPIPSVVRLMAENDSLLWVCTSDNYLYRIDKNGQSRHKIIEGLTFNKVNRTFLSRSGTLWLLSEITPVTSGLWPRGEGINRFDGSRWFRYLSGFPPLIDPLDIGGIGSSPRFTAIAEDKQGAMWFATPASDLKRYDTTTQRWSRYAIGINPDPPDIRWKDWFVYSGYRRLDSTENEKGGMCWAIACDSSGYMWVSSWKNAPGCVVCFNPAVTNPTVQDYRRYFPQSGETPSRYMNSALAITVDTRGTVFFGSSDGRLICMRAPDPLTTSAPTFLSDENVQGAILNILSTPTQGTLIASNSGLFRKYYSNATSFEMKTDTLYVGTLTSVAYEEGQAVWLGTVSSGAFRCVFEGDSLRITDTVSTLTGLLSNKISDICVDKKRGCLWIGTDKGLTRYELGHTFVPVTDIHNVAVYPNPCSILHDREVIIENVRPSSTVKIYNARGRCVASLEAGIVNDFEWTFSWKPPRGILPGLYFVTVTNTQKSSVRKLLIIP